MLKNIGILGAMVMLFFSYSAYGEGLKANNPLVVLPRLVQKADTIVVGRVKSNGPGQPDEIRALLKLLRFEACFISCRKNPSKFPRC